MCTLCHFPPSMAESDEIKQLCLETGKPVTWPEGGS